MEVLGLTALPESLCEGKVGEVNKDRLDMVFPDIYFSGLWQLAHQNQQWQVVAVGRNVEERYRTACVGLASQIANAHGASKWWPQVQREFDHGQWLPDELGRFYDVEQKGFWANVSSWQQTDSKPGLPLALADISTLPRLTKQGFKDLRMTCQPALHRELQAQDGYAEIDLTDSGRPWPSILAAHKMRDEIVGPGVDRFAIASDERKLDKHQQHAPLVFCLVKRIDGKITTFSDLERTEDGGCSNFRLRSIFLNHCGAPFQCPYLLCDKGWRSRNISMLCHALRYWLQCLSRNILRREETFQKQCLPKDEYNAFRWAAGWEVKGRWEAFQFLSS